MKTKPIYIFRVFMRTEKVNIHIADFKDEDKLSSFANTKKHQEDLTMYYVRHTLVDDDINYPLLTWVSE